MEKSSNIHGSQQGSKSAGKTGGKTYGYIRVSTAAQRDDRQRIAMKEFGIANKCLFTDRMSGKDFDRPAYAELMAVLKAGDTVVVKSLDRLGRDYDEMLRQIEIIERKGVNIVILDLPLFSKGAGQGSDLTGKFIAGLVTRVLSYVAQMEREMNHQRTMEGLAAARARGVRLGRRPRECPEGYEEVRARWEAGEISARGAARMLAVSAATFKKWVQK